MVDLKMETERAAPCPWCGEVPDVSNDASFRLTDGVKYGALQCCIVGPEVRTDYKDVPHWKAKAIAAWNDRRASPVVGDDGLPPPKYPQMKVLINGVESEQCGYTAEQVRQAQRAAYEAGKLATIAESQREVVGDLAAMKERLARAQQQAWTERELSLLKFATYRFINHAHAAADEAAQDKRHKPGTASRLLKDAKDAEALVAKLMKMRATKETA
ncbi:hypothetical protein [Massilia sp. CT11-137]|uniref:hypothetical protein n=1 Tax=Massilia sp. CT11-137 TaxID=3393901 RepID=UPI0039AFAC7D